MKEFFSNLAGSLLDRICTFFRSGAGGLLVPAITGIFGFFRFVLWGVSKVTDYFNSMMASASSATGQTSGSFNGGTMIGIANYFVPLDTMFYCASLLLTLWLAACSYRFVKSWIPTVN